jgi:hypothetical protein
MNLTREERNEELKMSGLVVRRCFALGFFFQFAITIKSPLWCTETLRGRTRKIFRARKMNE